MFILYAIPIGVVLGYLVGGRLDRLGELHFRWAWLAIAGLAVQLLLFSEAAAGIVGGRLGEAVYVASTAAVLVAVLRNLLIPGLALVALGAVENLAAIVANGGVMPTTASALAAAGLSPSDAFSNSAIVEHPALEPLTDIFALPPWVPLANVFSIGDVLIGLGIVLVIALGMRGGRP